MKFGKLFNVNKIDQWKAYYIDYHMLKSDIFISVNDFLTILKQSIHITNSFYCGYEKKNFLLDFCLFNVFAIFKITKKYNKKNNVQISELVYDLYKDKEFYCHLWNPHIVFTSTQKTQSDMCCICYESNTYTINTTCNHIICWNCLLRCHIHGHYQCAYCREEVHTNPLIHMLEYFTQNTCNPFYLTLLPRSYTPVKKCLFIGIDGLRPDALLYAHTPNIDKLIQTGVIHFDVDVSTRPLSGPSWASILSGSNDHNIQTNEQIETPKKNVWNTKNIFRVLGNINVQTTACVSSWIGMKHFVQDAKYCHFFSFDHEAIQQMKLCLETSPEINSFYFLYLNNVDRNGHLHGFSIQSNEYIRSIERLDKSLEKLLKVITYRNISLIITTDHGGCKKKDIEYDELIQFNSQTALQSQQMYIGIHGLDLSSHRRTFQIYQGDIVQYQTKEITRHAESFAVYHSVFDYYN